ncbi:MAG: hypothetical protein OXC80_01955, partial [Gammaproteobacteria bacterium]|nr:hypothetical protein [Gammaproteobacteria bacterium]
MKKLSKFSFPLLCLLVGGLTFGFSANAQDAEEGAESNVNLEVGLDITESTSLEDLLQIIEERRIVENEAHRARERQFQSSRDQQQTLL